MDSCHKPSKIAARGKKYRRNKYRKWILPAICVGAVSVFIVNLLYDVEIDSNDVTTNGLRIFAWAFTPYKPDTSHVNAREPLFTSGVASISPTYIRQGKISDCNFLATIASYINRGGGRRQILNMIRPQPDGGYVVSFPGAPSEPVKIAALSPTELSYYAFTRDDAGASTGLWLPVLEKAYGQYRIQHQTLFEHGWRCLKHGILEGRFTSTPLYPGCGASFGAKDNVASALMTGHDTTEFATTDFELGEFGLGKKYATARQLMGWFRRAKVAQAFFNEQNGSLLDVSAGRAIATATTEQSTNCTKVGLRNKHAYSVIGYDCVKKQVHLYDPYGNTDYDSEDGQVIKRSGNVILSLEDFNKYFSHLNVEKINPRVSLASI